MLRLKISSTGDRELRSHLLRGLNADEEAAFLTVSMRHDGEDTDLIVRDVIAVPDEALLSKGRAGLEINPIFIAGVLKKARRENLGLVLCHSHPFSVRGVSFSGIDDAGEDVLFPRLQDRVPDVAHGAMVLGQESRDARLWLPRATSSSPIDEIVVVGRTVEVVATTGARHRRPRLRLSDEVGRQVLALGEPGQERLAAFRVGLVGGGGLGSPLFDTLVRTGVGSITVVDGDLLELHNVSRQTNAGIADVGTAKVLLLEQAARRIGFGTQVTPVRGWVQAPQVCRALLGCDVIVVATDNMMSRVFVSRLGAQYAIPIISAGIDIVPHDGELPKVGGHVAVQDIDGPCLDCLGLIDHDVLDREHTAREVRVANPYMQGRQPEDPVPSIAALNLTLAAHTSAEIIQLATGALRETDASTYVVFNGSTGEVRRVQAKAIRPCGVCAEVRRWGDRYPLPVTGAGSDGAGG